MHIKYCPHKIQNWEPSLETVETNLETVETNLFTLASNFVRLAPVGDYLDFSGAAVTVRTKKLLVPLARTGQPSASPYPDCGRWVSAHPPIRLRPPPLGPTRRPEHGLLQLDSFQ